MPNPDTTYHVSMHVPVSQVLELLTLSVPPEVCIAVDEPTATKKNDAL